MSDVKSLLPPNAGQGLRNLEQTAAIHITSPDAIRSLWNPATCDERFLPWLAWSFSVETWDHNWPVETRRKVVANAIEVHRIKGTPKAVKTALESLSFSTVLSEWFDYGGDPHTFRVDLYGDDVFEAGFDINSRLFEHVNAVLQNVKPVRSHYDLRFGETFENDVFIRMDASEACIDRSDLDPDPRTMRADNVVTIRHDARVALVVREVHEFEQRAAA